MTAPTRPARSPRPPVPNPLPVWKRSEAEEELWWAIVAAGQGMTLAEFDARCGVEPQEEETDEQPSS